MSVLSNKKPRHSPLQWLSLWMVLLATMVDAQPRRPIYESLAASVVTIAVSPDGSTLAIARSSSDPVQRTGRVELWNTKSGELRRTISGFDGSVWSVAFSPDGQTLITASTEFRASKIQAKAIARKGTVVAELKCWDALSGEFIRKVSLPDYEGLRSLEAALSPDGTALAVVERYSQIEVLTEEGVSPVDPSKRERPRRMEFFEGIELRLIDAQTGNTRFKVRNGAPGFWGTRRLERPLFSPDGKVLAGISAREVRLWNVNTGDKLHTLKFKGRPVAISFSPDSRIVAVASTIKAMRVGESEISLWDLSTGKVINRLNGKNNSVAALQFGDQGRTLLIGSLQYEPARTVGTVKTWDLLTNRLASFDVHEGHTVSSFALLSDQSAIVLQSGSDVEIRDVKTWKIKHSFEANEDYAIASKRTSRFLLSVKRVASVAFSPDGTTVFGEIPEEGIRLWDPRTGGVKNLIQAVHASDSLVTISSNGVRLAELGSNEIRLWDLMNGTSVVLPLSPGDSYSTLALSRDGQMLAMGNDDEIILRKTTSDDSARTLKGQGATVSFLVFSDDGGTLVSADETGTIRIWEVTTGQLRETILIGNEITALAVDVSGQRLATAGADYLVSLWDLRTGALQSKLKKHDNVVNALVFSPDGKMLASGGDDRTAILWDVISGKSKRTLKGHDLAVTSLAFSPDGQVVASGSGNASVVLWNVTTGKLDRILR